MNNMQQTIEVLTTHDLRSRTPPMIVRFDFEKVYSRDSVKCYLIPCFPRHKNYAVMQYGETQEQALENAYNLFILVQEHKLLEKPHPTDKDQRYNNGYYREMIGEDTEVEWKRIDDRFFVTAISKKDANGFYIVDRPLPNDLIPFEQYVAKNGNDFYEPREIGGALTVIDPSKVLQDGQSLWVYDDIGFLSGSRGLHIVQEGKIVKTKGYWRS